MFWIAILGVAVAVFVITGNPFIACLLPFLTAGRSAVESAFWLRAYDPNLARGRTCFWFYLAVAGWRAATYALLNVLVFFFVETTFAVKPGIETFAQTMITLLIGLGASTILGIIGIGCALQRQVRVFVLPAICKKSGSDFSRITEAVGEHRGFNHAIFVLASSLFVPILILGAVLSIAGINFENPRHPNMLLFTTGLGIVMLGPVAAIPALIWLSHRIVARSPADCWSHRES